MEERLSISYHKKPCYDIVFEQSFDKLPRELSALSCENKRICIITDSNVEKLYADTIVNLLQNICQKVVVFSFPAGEESKTLDTVKDAYTFLIEEGFDRKDMLLALGGGVVGDLTGYTAATYLRGIDFIQVPTTLLSQVDSSIGGKTGVDFERYKNMVGAFHMPRLVYMNVSALKTLEDRQYFSGMAEVLKHGLIRDASYYEWLISNMYEISERDMDTLSELLYGSCTIKKLVVEKDPTEQGDRALLNFGHTIGHAIEKYKNFSLYHGECVALGCVAAAYISWKHALLTMEEYYEIRDMFVPFELPISIEDIEPEEIVRLTKSDKKMEAGSLKFILLKKVGKAVIDRTVTDEEILAAVKEIYFSDEDQKSVKKSKLMLLIADIVMLILLVAAEQATKYMAVLHLKNQASIPLIPNILELRYLENRGAAFGMLQNQKGFLIFVAVIILLIFSYVLIKAPEDKKYRWGHASLILIAAGGAGNMIDRIRLDYVVDFIYISLINFPIFNVADIFVTIGTILLIVLLLFIYKEDDLDFLSFKTKTYREVKDSEEV